MITIPAKEDDIYFIDYALKVNAMIVTHDSFRDKKDDQGNVIKRERSLYPNRDWTDIDRRTLRDFRFVKDQFILPSLTQKGPSLPLTEKSTILSIKFMLNLWNSKVWCVKFNMLS